MRDYVFLTQLSKILYTEISGILLRIFSSWSLKKFILGRFTPQDNLRHVTFGYLLLGVLLLIVY